VSKGRRSGTAIVKRLPPAAAMARDLAAAQVLSCGLEGCPTGKPGWGRSEKERPRHAPTEAFRRWMSLGLGAGLSVLLSGALGPLLAAGVNDTRLLLEIAETPGRRAAGEVP